jgi:hypothetical protein
MKLLKTFALIFAAHTLLFSTCSKKDDVIVTNTAAIAGPWKVSLYFNSGKDETAKFSGYLFSFNSGGQLTATNGAIVVNGTWAETGSKFSIDFGTDPVLSKANSNWLETERTATTIKLKDDNPAKTDKLEFVKN